MGRYKDKPSVREMRTAGQNAILSDASSDRNYRRYRMQQAGSMLRILFLVFLVLLGIRIFWQMRNGSSNLSFAGLLDWFSNLNSVEVNVDVGNFFIGGDWGIFDGLRNFFNIFAQAFGVIVWLFSNILNLLLYLVSFVRFIFS